MRTKILADERVRCCVPFCRRTRAPQDRFAEWVCPTHWTAVDRRLRRLHARCKKAANKATWRNPRWGWAVKDPDSVAWHAVAREARVWERCKRQAIERAAGI